MNVPGVNQHGAGGACGRHNMLYEGRRCPKCLAAGDMAEAQEHLEHAQDKVKALSGLRDGLTAALAESYAENKALREALREDVSKWSFQALVSIAELILGSEYPAEVFTGESGDPGPRFVVRLREAIAECRRVQP